MKPPLSDFVSTRSRITHRLFIMLINDILLPAVQKEQSCCPLRRPLCLEKNIVTYSHVKIRVLPYDCSSSAGSR